MKAEIITIGDEILIGQIVDTNSAWMGQELNKIGIDISIITSISDTQEAIVGALSTAAKRSNLVLITGGLGPTKDDITKEALCKFFNTSLVSDSKTLEEIRIRLQKRGVPMIKLNRDQALVPKNAKIITNNHGSAPCMWFQQENTIFVSMPGVPSEMKGIMTDYVLEDISKKFNENQIIHETLIVQGIAESVLADKLELWENSLPPQIKLAYLPSPGIVRLRLSARGSKQENLNALINSQIEKIKPILAKSLINIGDHKIELIIAKKLIKNKLNISTAESCTGGNIAHLFTSNSGSSEFFKGSIVAYCNEVKNKILKVSKSDLENYGAVSKPVVEQMAKGALELLDTDFAISTSGIAGPTGGSEEKPVGTVWIAIASKTTVVSKCFFFTNNREKNIRMASVQAMNMLINEIEK